MSRRGDRLSVVLFSLTAFFLVLALLGSQLGNRSHGAAPHALLVRRIYRTTVLERVIGASAGGAANTTSVSQSAAVSGGYSPAPVATRTS